MPGNVITETWLAYAFERPVAVERVRAALARVGTHYGAQLAEPPPLRASLGDTDGLALWRHDDGSRWPAWAEGEGIVVAATAAPAGWRRVVGEMGAAEAPVLLGRALAERPERLAELVPPFVIGIREASAGPGAASGRLTIVNDFAGAGRIYEKRLDPGAGALGAEGWVWSNRLGALPIFAGEEPEPDERGWSLFAAAGWFIADATPIRSTTKVAPGTAIVVRAGAGGAGAHIHHHQTRAAGELVTPHEVYFRGAVDEAANQAIGLARDLAELFDEPPSVDLSGGRDSRISAAGAVAAGIDCRFATGDQEPGELEIAKQLVTAAPHPLEHLVTQPETDPDDDLRRRVAGIHLVHDGMRNPQEIRRPMALPIPVEPTRPTLSGHGGEIAHGFYYPSPGKLSEVREGGEEGLGDRLEQAARQKHSAAHRGAYRAYREEVERALAEGRRHGLAGPALLDYFYLVQRLAYRSGLGARSGRSSACATPAFVRASFDLTPDQRLDGKLHHDLIARLVPEWSEVPFFEPDDAGPLPEIRRARIWEKPGHAETVEEMIADGKAWPDLFRRRPVRAAWKEAREGKAHQHWEAVFNRIVWREGFEEHLRELGRAATAEPAPVPA
ncbi:MAG TPA: hypothetical protein VN458_00260 [Solirubrobacterales bacterium]|nr:hypothetical protein [Solirubrobacterales bacterium]